MANVIDGVGMVDELVVEDVEVVEVKVVLWMVLEVFEDEDDVVLVVLVLDEDFDVEDEKV